MFLDWSGNRRAFTRSLSGTSLNWACLVVASLALAPVAGSFAQTPSTKTVEVKESSVSGGTLRGTTKLVTATSAGAASIPYTDSDGQTRSLDLKKGDKLVGLEIKGGNIVAATAAGGQLTSSVSLTLDANTGTVAAQTLTGTTLKGARLGDAVVSTTGQQKFKVNDSDITGTFTSEVAIQVTDANLENVTVDAPVVPQSLVVAKEAVPGATEAANITTVGDYFKFRVNVEHFTPSDTGRSGEVTAPRGSCFRVSQEFDRKDPTDPFKTQRMARGSFATGWAGFPWGCLDDKDIPFDAALSYDVPRSLILEERDRNRFGWTYGALVAPFKYYTKLREFSAGASVGPYLGYRVHDRQGSNSVVAVSIGLATATIKTDNADGTTSSSNTTGVTGALAYLLEIKGTFNMGVIAGADYFSKSQNVPTSAKLWLGLSFGYKLD